MRRHPFLWSFDLSTPTPTFTFPTDAERIAEVLADIKADLARLMQLFDEFAHGWAGFG
jgi:hypothetical protein